MAKKKKLDDLSPWAKYQKEHNRNSFGKVKRSEIKKSNKNKKYSTSQINDHLQKWFANVVNWFKNIHLLEFNVISVSLIVMMSLVVIGGIYLATPFSRVRTVSVVGNKRVSDSAILKKSGIKKNQLLVTDLWNRSKTESKIKKGFSDIEKVSLINGKNNRIQIRITENAVMGYVVRNGLYYTVKQDGTMVGKHQTQPSGNYPIFRNFKQNENLNKFLRKYSSIPNSVQNSISEVDFSPTKTIPNRIQLYMNDGNEVYAIIDTFDKKMKYYPEISASMKNKGIINFEVGAYSYPFSMKDEENNSNDSSTTTVKKKNKTKESKSATNKKDISQSKSTQKSF
ncbi:cell division protein FtsQ/DivIB [Pediococcus claussenii]|uniref:Cell division protein DivIB n=1 Tax=Pediococcus claussenii (strain ATCC BAA-344 / DSM 14800 / JCM 18046 / KCTC 3811 / LMG 21948 / P06) TaxID=701521 RepID=G8PCU5_PEDCP|nr:cell division protein FtsQ/DivIB [Pediococcus claussenii]AEV95080.1 Cell division protein FtsQ [Pediococcus claussenii ATCC BAA-344]ANZ70268.1 hypothetical protein AYR57_08050 [Pediococcus claussenii]ANZ72084.1 hypothetical protein AYR58_08050 [Pediococcus claussenii]KRN18941.1 ftsQ protein [Pediococcus claussenii]